ncbi:MULTISPECIES: ABC transporter ATP-binding protein [Bacillus]|uniref:ABC transporter ATP-binding protein n=1 Tax=Bacillus TaxID=1386 RepID=UPI0001A19176|nr:ABC transporter ATP-binding protein [Bacillus pseudomycoides]EEM14015.1 ABC transporter,ATP/GTP-binding site motif A [Bacillus pseudomycoides DSM 12442]MED1599550.1 ABC transporter ATP-binding protein [Bacillus pseudomycoides]MED4714599.1 ABC transporter ATP-binding protein [Bacillus pseudomycoides]OOR48014.1 sodium ABC transporter ATP-binding protein [Bacillus pseudomycoides]PDY08936.1 ABC transporter ATP-binding protein [Bacillus pseudomycoides]
MENIVELKNVSKTYNGFSLKNASFNIKKGFVTGFIGANGAGKSTTIKLIMDLISKDSGDIKVFGKDYQKDQVSIKERIGFVYDDNNFYEDMTVHQLKKFIAPAYKKWDENLFQSYIRNFELPTNIKMKKMSKGMKMKTSLAFALSHHAEFIIMDEPTSGLDPVFRREILDILYDLMVDQDKTIFFSTHITTDLDRIADYIVFIHNGEIVFEKDMHSISEEYAIVKGDTALLTPKIREQLIGIRETNIGFEALTSNTLHTHTQLGNDVLIEEATLEDIMYYTKKGNIQYV